jgi:hypothetical protein
VRYVSSEQLCGWMDGWKRLYERLSMKLWELVCGGCSVVDGVKRAGPGVAVLLGSDARAALMDPVLGVCAEE